MSYHVYLFRKEVKENNAGLDFLENDDLVMPFSDKQFGDLKERLLKYGYQVERETGHEVSFRFRDGKEGIMARLTRKQLSFSSGHSQDGIFEIAQTASEFTDSDEFMKFDPQQGSWEEF